jgi:hypothetical protein
MANEAEPGRVQAIVVEFGEFWRSFPFRMPVR